MIKGGADDAKTQGEEVLITNGGRSLARLIPEKEEQELNLVIDRLKELREGVSLGDDDWKELRDLGRR